MSTVLLHAWAQNVRWWQKLRRMPWHIMFTFAQPVVWLLLFGNLMKRGVNFADADGGGYLAFMLPGVVAFTIFGNTLMSAGVSLMFDHENGFLERLLSTPVSRTSILLGRYFYVAALGTVQVLVILLLGSFMGAHVVTGLPGVAAILVFSFLLGLGFAVFSMSMAFLMTRHDAFFAATNFLGMPLMFISSALVPLDVMPSWMRAIAMWNPMTFGVEAMRSLVLRGWEWKLLGEMALWLLVADAFFLLLGGRIFRRHLY